ncbi:hypothetical protein MNB_SV-14-215 [hydrothermal vent metagenome]|uniref:Porin domain-containing protein n=1 Tax=hydrothermal vent metagenome TaxID=652676 RepID=A0A1W1BF69_9ZZZZ
MKKSNMIKIATGLAFTLLTTTSISAISWKHKNAGSDAKLVMFGFSQINADMGDGAINKDSDSKVKFGADRIRLGWKYFSGNVVGKVFLDFNQATDKKEDTGFRRVMKDAFVGYNFNNNLQVKAGLIKTPVGMGFTIPGWNLDVIKRGFDKKLAFERGAGLMLSGRDMGFGNNAKVNGLEMGHERPWKGFGYDLMIANQTTRSGAVKESNHKDSEGNAYMGRVMFDWGQELHTELSYGTSPMAGGTKDSKDYNVLNFGVDSHLGRSNLKFEYYDVKNIQGRDGWDMSTTAVTGTYFITDTVELAVKDIRGSEKLDRQTSDVSNTYLGVNFYLNPANNKMDRSNKRKRNSHKVMINYVVAGGDTKTFNVSQDENFKGKTGSFYRDDAILAQYQFKF